LWCAGCAVGAEEDEEVNAAKALVHLMPLGEQFARLALQLAVCVAILGYVMNDRSKHKEEQRRLAFERCNQQLEHFFGPLQSRLNFVHTARNVMARTYAKMAWKDHPQKDVSDSALLALLHDDLAACEQAGGQLPLAKLYVTFTRDIAMPAHRKILDDYVTKGDADNCLGHSHDQGTPLRWALPAGLP